MRKKTADTWLKALSYIFLILISAAMLLPFYWMIISSVKSSSELSQLPPTLFPVDPQPDNYSTILTKLPLLRYFFNSVAVALGSTVLILITSTFCAFAMAFYTFPGRKLLLSAILITTGIPFEVMVITNYSTVIQLGWNDNLIALILPYAGNLIYTYMLYIRFRETTSGIYRAARADGASKLVFLLRILIPSTTPLLLVFFLFNFISSWNSFMWPMLVLKSSENRTLPFALYAFMTEGGERFELMMAMSVILLSPLLLIFVCFRKTITKQQLR